MKQADNEFGISVEDATSELASVVEQSSNHMFSEYSQLWEQAEAYFGGKTRLKIEEGRSSLVKTETRDVIRSLMPNIMRVLLHSRKPVIYRPHSIRSAAFAEQQSHWAVQQFYANGGYMTLYSAVMESFKLKAGPIKTYWEENTEPEHIFVTGISAAEVAAYSEQEDLVVESVEERELPTSGEIVYDIHAVRYFENGRIVMQAFPVYEFFVEETATNLQDYVHGHRRSVSVSEAIEMGIEYDNWRELDDNDPKTSDAANVEQQKRGYVPTDRETSDDLMNYRFLLTEAYCKFDLDGDGVPEKYVFYLGGTTYTYLHHEQVEDFCIDIVCHDPVPFSVIGRSIVDITMESQDNETAVLRAVMDNAMMANNPRPAADPTKVNFHDLMNNTIGAPIRTKGDARIDYTETPFTAAQLLPFLQYLEQDAQMRVGVTKAAAGLDPDAMQSTDKQAVMNTIQLSQGQVELMARNIIETGLIPVFKRLLRLSMRHMDKRQMIRHKGALVPVDISNFDPNLVAEPGVGLGTTSPEQKMAALQFVYAEQQKYLMSMGMDNPFTSLSQIYNTLEDMVELGGLTNVGRYFNYVDKNIEAMIAQKMAEANAKNAEQQAAMQPVDPGRSLLLVEGMKSRVTMQQTMAQMRIKELELQGKALEVAEKLDLERDRMAQDRVIEFAKIKREELSDDVKREQDSTSASRPESRSGTASSGGQ
jgi:hypothetical protein